VIGQAERWPRAVRRVIAAPASLLAAESWDRGYRTATRVLSGPAERLIGEKMIKLLSLIREQDAESMYRSLMSAWQRPQNVMALSAEPCDPLGVVFRAHPEYDLLARMQLSDQLGYLPADLLAKVDRVSMAVGLEVRVPLIDHNVVALSWRLPASAKIRDGSTKRILRDVLYRRVPRELIERPKVGFTVPLADWLRGPLRGWAEELLSPARLATTGLLQVGPIRNVWRAFLGGRRELALRLWAVLMFEAWRERWA
jgi:asparagine synthase (glutamine-hydrolysing)